MYLLVNLYAAGVSVYFGGDLGQAELREGFLQPFANFMARGGGLPALFLVLTACAANVLTRATGAANTVQGVLLGLVSAAGIQLVGRAFGPFSAWELVAYPLLGVAGGWLGVALSRGALVRQESLYRATGALYAVDAPRDVAAVVGENLAGTNEERVTLWGISPRPEEDGGLALEPLGAWAPPGTRPWPEGSRLTAERLPALAELRRGASRVVRGEDLPPTGPRARAERGPALRAAGAFKLPRGDGRVARRLLARGAYLLRQEEGAGLPHGGGAPTRFLFFERRKRLSFWPTCAPSGRVSSAVRRSPAPREARRPSREVP